MPRFNRNKPRKEPICGIAGNDGHTFERPLCRVHHRQNALSSLPISQLELDGAYKFLSQAADYAKYISTKDEISQSDYDNLALLLTYAQKYADRTEKIVQKCAAGGKITENEVLPQGGADAKVSSFSLDFTTAENTFENYPTLLYDGPFADAVLNKESQMIKNASRRSRDECRKIAARALGVEDGGVVYKNEESGTIPAYVFPTSCARFPFPKRRIYSLHLKRGKHKNHRRHRGKRNKHCAEFLG